MADGSGFLDFGQELVVDLFAGGGGASLGIERAYRAPDVAVNHNPVAIAVHQVNHPATEHYTCDVFEVDPLEATQGRPVGVLWASPDCRHHSKAKGGKPRNKRIRGLAWVVVKWAKACKPRLIHLENVEEFADWGPLLPDGQPCKARKGMTFRRWVRQLERLGYRVEWRELVAADYGAPTIRKRLYVIARCDKRPIVWPAPTHAKGGPRGLRPWRSAAECIDFSLPSRSIFDRKRAIVVNTCRRVAKGIWRHTLTAPDPFIVPLRGTGPDHTSTHAAADPLSTVTGGGTHHALASVHFNHLTHHGQRAGHVPSEPLRTVTGAHRGEQALIAAHVTKFRTNSIGSALDAPLHTVTAGGDMARPAGAAHAMGLVTAFLEQAAGGPNSNTSRPRSCDEPVSTITSKGSQQRLVTAYMVKFYSTGGQWNACNEPMHTVPAKDRMGLVEVVHVPADILAPDLLAKARRCAAFMHEHLPEHFPEPADIVLIGGYVMVDITLRMLTPRELARAQGFPDEYVLECGADGKSITKTDQVRLIGNSVCPDVAEALIRANAADLIDLYARQAA